MAWVTQWGPLLAPMLVVLLLPIICTGTAGEYAGYRIQVYCDDVGSLWVDGELKNNSTGRIVDAIVADSSSMPSVIAIKCRNDGGNHGIISTVVNEDQGDVVAVSDDTWRCSKNIQTISDPSWEHLQFKEGDAWHGASVVADHLGYNRLIREQLDILRGSRVIWGQDGQAYETVYCRQVLACKRPMISNATFHSNQTKASRDQIYFKRGSILSVKCRPGFFLLERGTSLVNRMIPGTP